ncbi:globin-coupled sensor protein [Hirschia baltica]|uniref:Methyl-accepting chemotaxis sensory transducer n=1 Tax=Hirschia baltica (strain ATCC 49814 / DSM 5838 / IFAM 1418) TaxID=582402 RepID=C6XNE4_HIRBI|nr:globin-coupled sensor protein [Hirschia baltica]ACT60088.1 methyl-accepting chemotaxis sensory transducer [Hirschia baltica ATCC 49814]
MTSNIELENRLTFIGMDANYRNYLKQASPIILEALPSILDDLYKHFDKHSSASGFFPNSAVKKHARDKQLDHWTLILTTSFGEAYINSVQKIGAVHAQLDLPLDLYIGSYSFIIERLNNKLAEVFFAQRRKGLQLFQQCSAAVSKTALLDMELTVSTIENLRHQSRDGARFKIVEDFESKILVFVDKIANSVGNLELTARTMGEVADSTSQQSISMSAAAEQTSSNVSVVAKSAEEMGGAVQEIAQQVNHASRIAAEAVTTAQETGNTINSLSVAASKVGDIISLISDIAEQTNLLALNATIESARAGEAGKGFAVVASEVKQLASQTAKATSDIRSQIEEMLTITSRSVEAIDVIQSKIDNINSTSISINAAVEEQASSTQEIARNTREAARGTQEVSEHIINVKQGAVDTGTESSKVIQSSAELGDQASVLREEVRAFLQLLKAA